MKYSREEWVADIRVGIATVHVDDKNKFHCLDGMRNECIYWANGWWVQNIDTKAGKWILTEEAKANAHLIAACPRMVEFIKGLASEGNKEALSFIQTLDLS